MPSLSTPHLEHYYLTICLLFYSMFQSGQGHCQEFAPLGPCGREYIHVSCRYCTPNPGKIDPWLHALRPATTAHFHPILIQAITQSLPGPACHAKAPKWHRPRGPERALTKRPTSDLSELRAALPGHRRSGVYKHENSR